MTELEVQSVIAVLSPLSVHCPASATNIPRKAMVQTSIKRYLYFALTLAVASASGNARDLPHVDLVKKYLQGEQYIQLLKRCKSGSIAAPPSELDPQTECWAAATASELRKTTPVVAAMVLNDGARKAAISRCKMLSIEQRFKSADCEAAGRAETFISLRQPRLVETLKPVTFK